MQGDTLTIRARRQGQEEHQGRSYLLRERRVTRTLTLPRPVDADRVSAGYEHGELVLTLPKVEQPRGGAAMSGGRGDGPG